MCVNGTAMHPDALTHILLHVSNTQKAVENVSTNGLFRVHLQHLNLTPQTFSFCVSHWKSTLTFKILNPNQTHKPVSSEHNKSLCVQIPAADPEVTERKLQNLKYPLNFIWE